MSVESLTLQIPEPLYRRLRERADSTNRSVEAEMLDVLASAVSAPDELPADLDAAVGPLALLDDAALWRAARSQLGEEAAARLEELHLKRQREGLTPAESEAAAALTRQYERAMLVRARAAVLLRQRGYDVTALLASTEPPAGPSAVTPL